MPTFTVHEPPPRKTESVTAPERFVFVRDGFHFWAFLLPPVWLLVRRLWLAFFIYVVVTLAVAVGIKFAGLPSYVQSAAAFVIALIIGFEASTIRRWTRSTSISPRAAVIWRGRVGSRLRFPDRPLSG
jgi:hypothetical protein